jgi:hypothetical protein
MGAPPKRKSLREGTMFLWRLHFQNLRAALFHGQLLKVRVMLKVYRVTEFCVTKSQDRPFWKDVKSLYLLGMIIDYLRPKKIFLPFYEFSLTIILTQFILLNEVHPSFFEVVMRWAYLKIPDLCLPKLNA